MADHLSPLLPTQKLFIDAHGHENNSVERDRMYEDPTYDLHIHKKTNPISRNGKVEYEVEIRIPINNPNREISVDDNGEEGDSVPGRIRREVKNALKDKKIRELFAKEVSEVMQTYKSKLGDKEKAEATLQRFADVFRVKNIPIKDEWFTHITNGADKVAMLSVISDSNHRYNFLATNNYMLAEEAEPTRKTIIQLSGAANRGKSEIIKMVFEHLYESYPEYAIIFDDGKWSGDVKAMLFVQGAKVGIESQGDPNSRQEQSIDDFVNLGCDVILIASRTRGMTVDSIRKNMKNYQVFTFHPNIQEDKMEQNETNRAFAQWLSNLVKEFAGSAFVGL